MRCKLRPHGFIGLMFRRRDNGMVVIVKMAQSNVAVLKNDMVVSPELVQEVVSAEWWSHMNPVQPQGPLRDITAWDR